jgi:hypothetical protein
MGDASFLSGAAKSKKYYTIVDDWQILRIAAVFCDA